MEDVDYEQISAMLVDETGTVIAYGKIKDIDGNGIGTVDVKIPESAENGKYILKLFAEDILYEEESNNIHTAFDLPSGSLASNAVDFEIEVEGRDITEIKYDDYHLACEYSGSVLSLPQKDEIIITGASFEDVEFEWYKNSVSEENRITSAPGGAGTYYLVASIPDTGTRRGSSVTSEPIVISPKTVTPYISGSISKVYDGSDSIEGADGTLAVKLDGTVEGDDLLAGAGSIRWQDCHKETAAEMTMAANCEGGGEKPGNEEF